MKKVFRFGVLGDAEWRYVKTSKKVEREISRLLDDAYAEGINAGLFRAQDTMRRLYDEHLRETKP